MATTELTSTPNLAALYAKAAATAPMRKGTADELPHTEYVRHDVTIDRDHLAEYNRVCGFRLGDQLPPTYPHVLSFPMSVRLMTDPGFPFPLVGLVHVANSITLHEPLLVTDTMTLRVRVADLRPHPKGTQFDVVTEACVDDRVVWSEHSTYLRRGESDESAPRQQRVPDVDPGEPSATWSVPGDLGRRYASVSGDSNPIHLHALTAKAFGFPRAIAHGMWSKARCLAAFEGRLPDRYTTEVEFAKPILLPSKVDFTERAADGGSAEGGSPVSGSPVSGSAVGGRDFALHSRSGKPHLRGTVR